MNTFAKPMIGSQIDPQHPLSQGCVMALLMLEGSGNRTYDLTHNGNDGVFQNGPLWKPGRNGAAIEFDGSNDYVDLGNPASLNITKGITIEGQICPNTAGGNRYGRWLSKNGVPLVCGMLLGPRTYCTLIDSSNTLHQINSNVDSVPYHQWSHIMVTWDGKIQKQYVNNICQDQTKSWSGSLKITANDLYVGNRVARDRGFDGLISDVRIWDRALSPDEVQDLYINPYGFIYQPQKYWLMPQGVTIPPHLLFRRVA